MRYHHSSVYPSSSYCVSKVCSWRKACFTRFTTHWLIGHLITLFSLCVFANEPQSLKLLKGHNMTLSLFQVDEADLTPYLPAGYEAYKDEYGNFRVLLGSVEFSDTYGLSPFQEVVLFTDVKPKGKSSEVRSLLPLWGAINTQDGAEHYQLTLGLPLVYQPSLNIQLDKKGQTTRLSFQDNQSNTTRILMKVRKKNGAVMTDLNNTVVLGRDKRGGLKMSREVFGSRFREAELSDLNIQSPSDSPLKLIDPKRRLFTLISENHTVVFM